MDGLSEKLHVDLTKGLRGSDYAERREYYGHNELPKLEAEGFWEKFFGALEDFMLKVLITAGCFSIIVDMVTSNADERKTGRCA